MSEKGKEDFDGTITGVGYKKSMDDPNKPPMTLIPPTLGIGIARVLGKGAEKYARGQWMNGMSFSEVVSAMRRHLDAWEMGEDLDADSGLPHIYHIGAELAFLSWFQHGPRSQEYEQFDDRLFNKLPKVQDSSALKAWIDTGKLNPVPLDYDLEDETGLGPIKGCPCSACTVKVAKGMPFRSNMHDD